MRRGVRKVRNKNANNSMCKETPPVRVCIIVVFMNYIVIGVDILRS